MKSEGLNIYFFIALTVYLNPSQINLLGEKWMGYGRLYGKKISSLPSLVLMAALQNLYKSVTCQNVILTELQQKNK
jgi:hypothetical protein